MKMVFYPGFRPSALPPFRRWAAGLRKAFLALTGMPDYHTYLAHLRDHHPERAAPSEREYFEEYLRCRYEGGPTRCC